MSDEKIKNRLFTSGGAEEDRTPDLRIANATLSQLSYGPISTDRAQTRNIFARPRIHP